MENEHEIINRSKKNLVTGMIYQIINMVAGLVLPYLFITSLGSETNGLLSSIGQLFVYLGLLEAGVGTASLQALYKPVAGDDKKEISSILAATNHYYLRTGLYYSVSIIVLALCYPFLVDSALSASTIRAVILLQGAGQVVGFFTQAKYSVLLKAEGKSYFLNLLLLGESILRNAGKIAAIALGFGVVVVQGVHCAVLCLKSLIIVWYIHRNYPWLDLATAPNFAAITQKSAALFRTAVWVVFNHTDILVLTICTRNLALVSVYSLYTLVFEAIQNVTDIARNSYQFRVGILAQTERTALQSFFSKYSILIHAFSVFCFCLTYLCVTPFLRIYTAGVSDADYLAPLLPELFLSYKLLYSIRAVNQQLIEAGGHFSATKKIAFMEASINIVVSVGLVFIMGIYGVLFGTIAALIYSTVAYSSFLKKQMMGSSFILDLVIQIPNAALVLLCFCFAKSWSIEAGNYGELIVHSIVPALSLFLCCAVVVIIQFGLLKISARYRTCKE